MGGGLVMEDLGGGMKAKCPLDLQNRYIALQ